MENSIFNLSWTFLRISEGELPCRWDSLGRRLHLTSDSACGISWQFVNPVLNWVILWAGMFIPTLLLGTSPTIRSSNLQWLCLLGRECNGSEMKRSRNIPICYVPCVQIIAPTVYYRLVQSSINYLDQWVESEWFSEEWTGQVKLDHL